jgi:hypothetical protein
MHGAENFPSSQQVALGFTSTTHADEAARTGIQVGETLVPLTRRPDYRPSLNKLTVSGVDCTFPKEAVHALMNYFTHYGRVLDITPRYWAGTKVHNGVWHVTLDRNFTKSKTPPPEVDTLLNNDIFIDVPGFSRVCHHCMTAVHNRRDCRTLKSLQAHPEQYQKYLNAIKGDQRIQQLQQQKKAVPPKPQPSKPAPSKETDKTPANTSDENPKGKESESLAGPDRTSSPHQAPR